jgi:hypothetical protein
MWTRELRINTKTADSKIGSQRDARDIIGNLLVVDESVMRAD